MKHKIFIDGEAGTTGLEVRKRLEKRDDLQLLSIDYKKRKSIKERLKFYKESDLTIMCLPDSESIKIMNYVSSQTKVIDTSTAHRVNSHWVYGMPELSKEQKNKIRNSNKVANPGCHATGFILLIKPFIDEGIISKSDPLCFNSITGYSGGGQKMIAQYEEYSAKPTYPAPAQYSLSQEHKHLSEIIKYCNLTYPPVFIPVVASFYRGMLINIPIHLRQFSNKLSIKAITAFYEKYYAENKLISVKTIWEPTSQNSDYIYADDLKNKDNFEIIISGNEHRITLTARYDNLGKGASGAAIQNMNIMLGYPEQKGLMI